MVAGLSAIMLAADGETTASLLAKLAKLADDDGAVAEALETANVVTLTIGGNEIALSNDTYNYEGTGSLPTSTDEVVATTKSQFATADVKIDNAASTVTITVTNQGGADIDGKTSHTYVITYPAAAEATQYTGYLNIEMMGNQLATNQEATVEITDNGNGTCTFSLPNFSLGGSASMGDIVVENVTMTEADGTTTYTGSVKGLSLAEGQIIADVELNGTIDANGTVDFKIDVTWVEANLPINVTFTSDPTSSVANIDANGTAIYGTTGAIAINGYTGTASIYGITGQLLKSVPVDGNALINIDGGIYIVRIDGTTAKVLVK